MAIFGHFPKPKVSQNDKKKGPKLGKTVWIFA